LIAAFIPIKHVFKTARINVLRASGERQYTWDYSNITGAFYVNLNFGDHMLP